MRFSDDPKVESTCLRDFVAYQKKWLFVVDSKFDY